MAEFLTGNSGTGKSTIARGRCEESGYGLLCSTTGVSAVNQGVVTLHSTLKFFDASSLARAARSGKLHTTLSDLRMAGVLGRHLVVDEVSMLDAESLDLIHNACNDATSGEVDVVLVGDFAQLPTVEGEFAFRAKCWPEYEARTTRLTKIWRQDDIQFLNSLDLIRRGDKDGADALFAAGAGNSQFLDPNFGGVTLVPTNNEAAFTNSQRFNLVDSPVHEFVAERRGAGPVEWKRVPDVAQVKVGTRVMITSNDPPAFSYANGDTGTVTEIEPEKWVVVMLDRTGGEVVVLPVTRRHFEYPHGQQKWMGEIRYMPVKTAYALTIHSSQGLTLPAAQIHIRHHFAGAPALMYVAISRVRTASNVMIVGPKDVFRSRINCHPDVVRYL